MSSGEGWTLFGSILGTAVGGYIGGPFGAAIGGSLLGGAFGSWGGASEAEKQQKKLMQAQSRQNKILLEKLNRDKEELFSSVRSSVSQTSGAMGAIY